MKKELILTVVFTCLSSITSAAIVTSQIDAYIDGSSYLKIQGDTTWWEHETFSAPGQWPNGPTPPPLPTIINGKEWYPDWSALNPYMNPFEPCTPSEIYGCNSDSVSGLLPPLASIDQVISMNILNARTTPILKNPDTLNDYTLSIYFNDEFGGADWYSIELTYETSEVPVPGAVWLFGSALLGFAASKITKATSRLKRKSGERLPV